ncbi:hypothetical protein DNU06_14060 [Putridiphycobacter roseus]|uniref:Lipoprotein n=1 Tax=Putridiphycobacter roseus TaxID=2219161 RepID=A0A2W1MVX2_9FLAO|nr:hypothetical protein [Putridiphycobacter roseus]PZE16249.1 hypothetical protein DNU06_14060 [Putridiphycobacter roseus]
MKKIFIISTVGLFLFTACNKNYTCECLDEDGEEVISSQEYPETSRENAKVFQEQCEEKECTWVSN